MEETITHAQTKPGSKFKAHDQIPQTERIRIDHKMNATLFLLSLLFVLSSAASGTCKPRSRRCTANSECCSNACLPLQAGSPYKYCKEITNAGGGVVRPQGVESPGRCAAKGATCSVASDCCSGVCSNFGTCWAANRSLRGTAQEVDENLHTE